MTPVSDIQVITPCLQTWGQKSTKGILRVRSVPSLINNSGLFFFFFIVS